MNPRVGALPDRWFGFQDGVVASRRGVWPEIVLPHQLALWSHANTGLTPTTLHLSDVAYVVFLSWEVG